MSSEAYHHIGVSLGILIFYSAPVIVMALSPILFKEPLILRKILCILVALVGMALISGDSMEGGENIFGLAAAGMGAIFYRFLIIFSKKKIL